MYIQPLYIIVVVVVVVEVVVVIMVLVVKRPGHKADHSPPSSAAVKEWVEL
jgi:hypothetical protein